MATQAPISGEALSTGYMASDRERREDIVAAVQRGLADVAAGNVIDDDELSRELDDEFGPLG